MKPVVRPVVLVVKPAAPPEQLELHSVVLVEHFELPLGQWDYQSFVVRLAEPVEPIAELVVLLAELVDACLACWAASCAVGSGFAPLAEPAELVVRPVEHPALLVALVEQHLVQLAVHQNYQDFAWLVVQLAVLVVRPVVHPVLLVELLLQLAVLVGRIL